jgi:hypothetical protein
MEVLEDRGTISSCHFRARAGRGAPELKRPISMHGSGHLSLDGGDDTGRPRGDGRFGYPASDDSMVFKCDLPIPAIAARGHGYYETWRIVHAAPSQRRIGGLRGPRTRSTKGGVAEIDQDGYGPPTEGAH